MRSFTSRFSRRGVRGTKTQNGRGKGSARFNAFEKLEDRCLLAAYPLPSFGTGIGDDPIVMISHTFTDPSDTYTFTLEPGDILGAKVSGAGHTLVLKAPDNFDLLTSTTDVFAGPPQRIPEGTPLPLGGSANLQYVITTPGEYDLIAHGNAGNYDLEIKVFRPLLERQAQGSVQKLFLDFDGATIDALDLFGAGNNEVTLSPLDSFFGLGRRRRRLEFDCFRQKCSD